MKKKTPILQAVKSRLGQVEVETAIVLPMVVFLILGLVQLGLLHQARLITKYAAYRAVRTGSLHNADVEKMEAAAVAAALPILAHNSSGTDIIARTDTPESWAHKYRMDCFKNNLMTDSINAKYAEVNICGPTKFEVGRYDIRMQVPFDDPKFILDGVKSKLRIEVTLNYRMIIPFANWIIYNMWRGKRIAESLRLQSKSSGSGSSSSDDPNAIYDQAANEGVYIIPIRAHYSMPLHSDVYTRDFSRRNECYLGDED
jgi:hypothetical protein